MSDNRLGSFQILEIPQNVGRKNRMIGAVVPSVSSTNPFDRYAPYWDNPRWTRTDEDKKELRELQKTIDFFWKPLAKKGEQGVKLENVIARRGEAADKQWKVQLTEALKAYGSKAVNEDVWIEAGEVEIYTMDNPDGAIRTRLSTCKPWKEELQELYQNDERPDPKFYIITGVYTCKNMRVGWAKEKSSGGGFAVGIPGEAIAAAAGAPPLPNGAAKLLDVNAKYDDVKQTKTELSARIPHEILFAFRYHIVNLTFEDYAPPKQPNLLIRTFHRAIGRSGSTSTSGRIKPTIQTISLGPPVRGPGMITAYGSDEDQDDLFYWEEPDYIQPDVSKKEAKAA